MSTPNITRADAIRMLTTNATFMAFLKDLKAADGYTPEAITFIDDHVTHEVETWVCTDVIATIRLKADGTPTPDGRSQSRTMWIYPGFSVDWKTYRTQNPLYVHEDGKIHNTTMAHGAIVYGVTPGSSFHRIVHDEKGVHLGAVYKIFGLSQYETHIHLTVPELDALRA